MKLQKRETVIEANMFVENRLIHTGTICSLLSLGSLAEAVLGAVSLSPSSFFFKLSSSISLSSLLFRYSLFSLKYNASSWHRASFSFMYFFLSSSMVMLRFAQFSCKSSILLKYDLSVLRFLLRVVVAD